MPELKENLTLESIKYLKIIFFFFKGTTWTQLKGFPKWIVVVLLLCHIKMWIKTNLKSLPSIVNREIKHQMSG